MWLTCLVLSVSSLVVAVLIAVLFNAFLGSKKQKINLFYDLFAGVFVAALLMFFPIHQSAADDSILGIGRSVLLSLFNSMQVFAIGCEYGVVQDGLVACPEWLLSVYQIWASALFAFAPLLTVSAILSLFKNLSIRLKWMLASRWGAYLFSSMNERSMTLAKDLRAQYPHAMIMFAQAKDDDPEIAEWLEEAKQINVICFPGKLSTLDFIWNSRNDLCVFAIDDNETENINCALELVGRYRSRENTRLYVFADGEESEVLLNGIDVGKIRLRRINEAYHLIYRLLDETGKDLFDSAREMPNGEKRISVVVVGMGAYGTEMVKAVSWFCQMYGYQLEINAFDHDPLAEEKFTALAPELMSKTYNGVKLPGEAQYTIKIHSGMDVHTATFANAIAKLDHATYVLVALGNDQLNITTSVRLRMYFERLRIHPMIRAIVYNSQQKEALSSIQNFRGQAYDITFLGDIETIYTESMIMPRARCSRI